MLNKSERFSLDVLKKAVPGTMPIIALINKLTCYNYFFRFPVAFFINYYKEINTTGNIINIKLLLCILHRCCLQFFLFKPFSFYAA